MKRIWAVDRVRGTYFDLEPKKLKRTEINSESIPARQTTLGSAKKRMGDSVKRFGVLQPPIFEKNSHGFNLVAGRHRVDQALDAGEEQFDGLVIKWLGEAQNDEELKTEIRDALRDETNFAMVPWSELENARYIFHDRFPGWTPEEVSAYTGMPEKDVARLNNLAKLPVDIANRMIDHMATKGRDSFDRGAIDLIAQENARSSRRMTPEQQDKLIGLCIATNGPITAEVVKRFRDEVKGNKPRGRKPKEEHLEPVVEEQPAEPKALEPSAVEGRMSEEGMEGAEAHVEPEELPIEGESAILLTSEALLEQVSAVDQLSKGDYPKFVTVQSRLVTEMARLVAAGPGA